MIRLAGSVSKSWLARQTTVAFDDEYYFSPLKRQEVDAFCNQVVVQVLPDLDVFYTESNLGRRAWYAPQQTLVGGIQPNMIIGMLLGARFLPVPDADADISPKCLDDVPVDALPEPGELLAHPLVDRWNEDIDRLLETSEEIAEPIPPFFWDGSGRAAVHGAVTSGLKYFGDEFFINLLNEPDQCERFLGWVTDVLVTLVNHFADRGRQVVTGIHVGECVACMLDVDSFRRFAVPAASTLGERFGNLRFHSCGCSDHVLDACREITGLSELDVGGETSVGKIRELFGLEFPVGIAPLVEDMRSESADGILDWFQRVERENDGGDLTIGFHLEADYRVENLHALKEAVCGAR